MTPNTLRGILRIVLPAVLATVFAHHALADPPGRVGRIAWMSGTVQLRNADTGEWNTAVLNYPLTNGDVLSTGPGARLELGIGSTTVRLDSSSELAVDQLDDERVRLYLSSGTAAVRLRSRESAQEFELTTRDGRFTTHDVGAFRFDYEQNVTSATPYMGTLHFESDDSQLDITAGQRAQFWYAGQTQYTLSSPVRDDFSDWNIARDERRDNRSTRRYVSQEMTGYEDLGGYGSWYDSVDYGPVWYPQVVSGWAPYRYGHWAWVAPWGWTWVDDAPWGFAPFHYGRWIWHRDRWGWVPGRHVARPVYAPALVAWINTPGVSIGVSSGPAVGWFPLAPREVYVPGYRCSPTYVRNVNITHVTRIENVTQIINEPQRVMERTDFANRRLPQAVTVVSVDVVTQRRPVAPAFEHKRDPGFFERVTRATPVPLAPVTAPALPARVDPVRRDRPADRGGDRHEDRRPGDARPNGPAPVMPVVPPQNAGGAPVRQPGLPPNVRQERPHDGDNPPAGKPPVNNPRFQQPAPTTPPQNVATPPAPTTPSPQAMPPATPLPPATRPDRPDRSERNRDADARRGEAEPRAPRPAPTSPPLNNAAPQSPAPQPVTTPAAKPERPRDVEPRGRNANVDERPQRPPFTAPQERPLVPPPAPRSERIERPRDADNPRLQKPAPQNTTPHDVERELRTPPPRPAVRSEPPPQAVQQPAPRPQPQPQSQPQPAMERPRVPEQHGGMQGNPPPNPGNAQHNPRRAEEREQR